MDATIFGSSSRRRPNKHEKLLSVCVTVCVLLSSLLPRFTLAANDYRILSQIMASQSILLEFFSFSTLPLKIVNELYIAGHFADSTKKKNAPVQDDNKTNSSSEFSLVNFDKKTGAGRYDSQRFTPGWVPVITYNTVYRFWSGRYKVHRFTIVSAMPLTRMFFFLLPRSSVSDHVNFAHTLHN